MTDNFYKWNALFFVVVFPLLGSGILNLVWAVGISYVCPFLLTAAHLAELQLCSGVGWHGPPPHLFFGQDFSRSFLEPSVEGHSVCPKNCIPVLHCLFSFLLVSFFLGLTYFLLACWERLVLFSRTWGLCFFPFAWFLFFIWEYLLSACTLFTYLFLSIGQNCF